MTKIEPMDIEDMRVLLDAMKFGPLCEPDCDFATHRLIVAWIEAEARARMLEWAETHGNSAMHRLGCFERNASRNILEFEKHDWAKSDWIAAVKAEVGWVEDK